MPTNPSLLARLSTHWRTPKPPLAIPIPQPPTVARLVPAAPILPVSLTPPASPAKASDMTSAVVTTVENAAIPAAVAVLQAFQTFVANLGTDPLQVAAKFPGALQVFVGSVELQAPTLASTEFATLQSTVNTQVAGWISSLNAKLAAAGPAAQAPVAAAPK